LQSRLICRCADTHAGVEATLSTRILHEQVGRGMKNTA
jgi:hypothetical protein